MKQYKLFWALTVCGWLVAAATALAHHAVAAQYDLDKPIEFSGTVVRMEFVNPHSMLHLEVTNPDGSKTVWKFQTGAIGTLRRLGLVRSSADGGLKAGDKVTASGFAARSGNAMGMLKVLRMPTGRVITTWSGDPNDN
jgi:uncharacterized protein DUF6152